MELWQEEIKKATAFNIVLHLRFLIEKVVVVGENCPHVVGFEAAGVDTSSCRIVLRPFAVPSELTIG